jgi:hypothetical protein
MTHNNDPPPPSRAAILHGERPDFDPTRYPHMSQLAGPDDSPPVRECGRCEHAKNGWWIGSDPGFELCGLHAKTIGYLRVPSQHVCSEFKPDVYNTPLEDG